MLKFIRHNATTPNTTGSLVRGIKPPLTRIDIRERGKCGVTHPKK